jgi:LysM repeat protein
MSELVDHDLSSSSPFEGLRPSIRSTSRTNTVGRTLQATMPVLLVGALAISSLGLSPLPAQVRSAPRHPVKETDAELGAVTIDNAESGESDSPASEVDTAAVTPAAYTVRPGDTVSGIAARYGLSTASVLAVNGLGWKSLIFPGQTLRLTSVPAPAAPVVPAAPTHVISAPTTTSFVTTPAPTQSAPSAAASYVIQRGDTITAIAKKFGVSVAAVLAANGLSVSSIIYAGRTLRIPGVTITPVAQVAQVGSTTVPLSPSMQANAKVIISVGRSLGVPDFGIVVALSTAAQESDLQNLSYGDRDSVGLFQQRPSTGWGTVAQLTTPSYAAALFYGGPSNPNKGRTRGLLDIAGWQSLTVTQAAQAVQISGAPNAYAKWEASARFWLAELS